MSPSSFSATLKAFWRLWWAFDLFRVSNSIRSDLRRGDERGREGLSLNQTGKEGSQERQQLWVNHSVINSLSYSFLISYKHFNMSDVFIYSCICLIYLFMLNKYLKFYFRKLFLHLHVNAEIQSLGGRRKQRITMHHVAFGFYNILLIMKLIAVVRCGLVVQLWPPDRGCCCVRSECLCDGTISGADVRLWRGWNHLNLGAMWAVGEQVDG